MRRRRRVLADTVGDNGRAAAGSEEVLPADLWVLEVAHHLLARPLDEAAFERVDRTAEGVRRRVFDPPSESFQHAFAVPERGRSLPLAVALALDASIPAADRRVHIPRRVR